jgi:hypothetical protein
MPSYSPELIQIMRAALDEVMTKIPLDQATPGIKAHMAEFILKAAANGQTSYDGLLAAASDNIQAILFGADVNPCGSGRVMASRTHGVDSNH